MPPKAKFTKEEIVSAAFEIVRTDGISALTARALGAKLGSSARPLFTVFNSIEEIQAEVMRSANQLYYEYVERGLSSDIPFKGVGTQYILFSINEPMLFRLLFMTATAIKPNPDCILPLIEEHYESILLSIENSYGLDTASSKRLYLSMWIYTHGIATLCATGVCGFTAEKISEMMTEVFVSLLKNIKAGESK